MKPVASRKRRDRSLFIVEENINSIAGGVKCKPTRRTRAELPKYRLIAPAYILFENQT
jgi:hypothetical protein